MSQRDFTTYRTGKIWRTYPEKNENINKNAFKQNLIKKYKLKNNAEFNQLYNRTNHALKVAHKSAYGNFPQINWRNKYNVPSMIIRYNAANEIANFLKKASPYTWEPVWGSQNNRGFFRNNKEGIVRIRPKLANKYPELQSYYIEPKMTLNSNGLYMKPSNYLQFRKNKAKEQEFLKTMRRAKGLEAMKPRLLSTLARSQRKARIREFFTYSKENMQKPNSPLKRKLPNTNAEKARKKAIANKEAANKAARNALNEQLAAARNRTRRLREENEARQRASAGPRSTRTWNRNVRGSVTRKRSGPT